jgi:hypothetical protein
MLDNRKVIIDEDLLMADTGSAVITATAAATVDGVAKVYDTGGGYTKGMLAIDIATLTGAGAATSNQQISIQLEGSNSASGAFTAWVRLAGIRINPSYGTTALHGRTAGDISTTLSTTTGIGRYLKPFHNDFHGTVYRYLRIYTTFNGSSNGSSATVKFKAWLSKQL